MQTFKNLIVWNESHNLTLSVYKITDHYPKSEVYGLTSQIRRACVSIPNNLVEGLARKTNKDKASFLTISIGSCSEVEDLIILSKDLGYIDGDIAEELLEKVIYIRKMLINLTKRITDSYS